MRQITHARKVLRIVPSTATAHPRTRFADHPNHRAPRRGHTDGVPGTNALADSAVITGVTQNA